MLVTAYTGHALSPEPILPYTEFCFVFSLSLYVFSFIFICMCECLLESWHITCEPGDLGGQKALDLLELKLQVVVSSQMGTGN